MTERGDLVTLTRTVDGKGVVGNQYLVLTAGDDRYVTVLFPGLRDRGGEEDGWGLYGDRLDYVRDTLNLDPDTVSAWSLWPGSWEHHSTVDPVQWVAEHIKGESMIPTEFTSGVYVTHREFTTAVRLLFYSSDHQRWLAHAPVGTMSRTGHRGWTMQTGIDAEQRAQVVETLAQWGVTFEDRSDNDGFWWVAEDDCTLVRPPEPPEALTEPEMSDIEVATFSRAWVVCNRAHPEGQQDNDEHIIIAEMNSQVYYLEPHGSTHSFDRLTPAVKQAMQDKGISPTCASVGVTNTAAISNRRTLTVEELRQEWPRFRGPTYDDANGPYGWGAFTVAVVEDGDVVWRPCVYTDSECVRVLGPTGSGDEWWQVDRYSSAQDYARRFGFPEGQAMQRTVQSEDVRWFLPYIDMSLVSGVFAGEGEQAAAIEALMRLDRRAGQFVEVLTRGAKRLDLTDEELTEFLDDVDLSGGKEYTITVPVEVTGTVTMRRTVKAMSQAAAMAQLGSVPGRGEHTIHIPHDDRIRLAGIPTISG